MKPVSAWLNSSKNIAIQNEKEAIRKDKQLLILEIRKAHRNWATAQAHFEIALDKDQIDYAIYALEAAEKRYEMLIKQAKQLEISIIDSDRLVGV